MSYVKVTLSISREDLADFDEWCAAARLPRGGGVAALLRLVRSLSSASTTITQQRQAQDAALFAPAAMRGPAPSETVTGERVIEPVAPWEP